MKTDTTKNPLAQILDAIVDAVAVAGPQGAPGGTLYAALMAHGCSLGAYQALMAALVKEKRLTRRGQLYFVGSQKEPTKYESTTQPGLYFWAEAVDATCFHVVSAVDGYDATEAFDDWLKHESDAEKIARMLANGENL